MYEIPVKIVLCAFETVPKWAHETKFSVGCWPPPGFEDDPQGAIRMVAEVCFERYNQYPHELFRELNEKELEDLREYRRKGNRSLSVGDFVIVGESVVRCDSVGWTIATLADVKGRLPS